MVKRVSILGLGNVGLSMAVCLASRGFLVKGIEVDKTKLELLSRGKAPFEENQLEYYLRKGIKKGALSFTHDFDAIADSEIVFVTVGTPSLDNGEPNLSWIKTAAKSTGEIISVAKRYVTVAIRSTILPET